MKESEVTLEMVKRSCFGCSMCLWQSCECQKGSKFIPKVTTYKRKEVPSCAAYAYYD
jgi:hypothetical protein